MAREFCDAIRLADHPEDEDAMVGILQQLFKRPRVSKKVEEAEYHKIFEQHDLTSHAALRTLKPGMLEGLGISVGHSLALVNTVFNPEKQAEPAGVEPAPPEREDRRRNRLEAREFPPLVATGWPELLAWDASLPGQIGQLRAEISAESLEVVRTALYKPTQPVPHGWDPTCRDNIAIFDHLLSGWKGGLPDIVIRQLSETAKQKEDGLEALL